MAASDVRGQSRTPSAGPHSPQRVSGVRSLGVVDLAGGTDQIVFNEHTQHVYTANAGSRNVSIVASPTMKPLGIVGTGRDAGTIATDPTTDRVYIALALAGIIAVYHDP